MTSWHNGNSVAISTLTMSSVSTLLIEGSFLLVMKIPAHSNMSSMLTY